MSAAIDKSIEALVREVIEGKLLLPEMQRPFVWKDYQVKNLFDSLYRGYPSGSLLVWETDALPAVHTLSVDDVDESRRALLLLDGQQRLTSLSAILAGRPLHVSNRQNKITILFNVETEQFDVEEIISGGESRHGKKMWIDLGQFFQSGTFAVLGLLGFQNMAAPETTQAARRLEKLTNIKHYTFRVNILDNMEYDEVTRIFIRVNSGGTRLGNADLALAQISSRWTGIADKVAAFNERLGRAGLSITDPGVAIRTLSALARHRVRLNTFFRQDSKKTPTAEKLEEAWSNSVAALETTLQFLQQNCLVDRLDMMPSPYVLIPLIAFFDKNKGVPLSSEQSKGLAQWFYRVTVWSRYSNSTETKVDQDLGAIYGGITIDEQIARLLEVVDVATGKRQVTDKDIRNRANSPYLLIMRVLARRNGAIDWASGIALGSEQDVKAFPLFSIQTITGPDRKWRVQDLMNQVLSAKAFDPAALPATLLGTQSIAQLQAQQIPTDPALWAADRFDDFLGARKQLLSERANLLMYGEIPQMPSDALFSRIMSLEEDLRELIATQLMASEGDNAWAKLVPHGIQLSTQQHIDKKICENPAAHENFDDIAAKLRQTMFSELGLIIDANWGLFDDFFGKAPATFDKQFASVKVARNACAHGAVGDLSEADRLHAQGGLSWFDDCLTLATFPENA